MKNSVDQKPADLDPTLFITFDTNSVDPDQLASSTLFFKKEQNILKRLCAQCAQWGHIWFEICSSKGCQTR